MNGTLVDEQRTLIDQQREKINELEEVIKTLTDQNKQHQDQQNQLIHQYKKSDAMMAKQFELLKKNTKYFDAFEKERANYISEINKLNEQIKQLKTK